MSICREKAELYIREGLLPFRCLEDCYGLESQSAVVHGNSQGLRCT